MINVTVDVCTKGRYYSTLPSCLISIATQSVLPEKIIIVDDTALAERIDLRNISVYQNIFSLFDKKGIKWEVVFGDDRGQVFGHNIVLESAKTDFIWRIDDDGFAENNVLEKLYSLISNDKKVGAVSCSILDPKSYSVSDEERTETANLMKNLFASPNFQWVKYNKSFTVDAEHLYSSFLYRKKAAVHGFCRILSKVGHREETIFTHEMFRHGYRLLIDTGAIVWHLREEKGGIRKGSNEEMFNNDEGVFKKYMNEWKIEDEGCKLIVLNSGIGDHYMFRSVFPEILEKHKDKEFILAVCYPEVFEEFKDIEIISIADAEKICDTDKYNIYKFCIDNNWKGHLTDAYRKMYL